MTEAQRNLILDLALKKMSKEAFLRQYPVDVEKNLSHIDDLVITACNEKREDDLDCALLLEVCFGYRLTCVPLLRDVLLEDWHHSHEDIVATLEYYEDKECISYLYKAALSEFKYLDFDDSYALAVKCIWAISKLNAPDSVATLRKLSLSDNPIIKDNANYQLQRLKA